MNPQATSVRIVAVAAKVILLTVAVWVLHGYVWPALSPAEVPVLQAALDPARAATDYAAAEALRFTPRFYYNELILLPARAGLPLAWAFAFWQLIMVGTLITGVRALGQALGFGEAASAVLLVWLLTVGVGTLGAVFFYTGAPVPAVWAGAAVAWGSAMAVRGRWRVAYAWFGMAVLLQFLVGFYAGLLALPFLLRAGRREFLVSSALWASGLSLVYAPMIFGRVINGGEIDAAQFVEIYAYLRHPHHLVPSTWGWPVWVQSVAFYVGAFWLINKAPRCGEFSVRRVLLVVFGLSAGALLVNWLFIEVWPVALVAKLQPARITPLCQGVFLVALAMQLQARIAQRDFLGAILLAVIPLSPFPGVLLVLFAILLPSGQASCSARHLLLATAVLLCFQPLDSSIGVRSVRYALWAALIGIQIASAWLATRPVRIVAAAVIAVVAGGAASWASLNPSWPAYLAVRFSVNLHPISAPEVIGERFSHHAPRGAVVLIPPSNDTSDFRLYAGCAVVVDNRNLPFTDRGVLEWKHRMDAVLGTPLTSSLDVNSAWQASSPARLVTVAQHYGARYILSRDDWHPLFPGTPCERSGGWTLWAIAP